MVADEQRRAAHRHLLLADDADAVDRVRQQPERKPRKIVRNQAQDDGGGDEREASEQESDAVGRETEPAAQKPMGAGVIGIQVWQILSLVEILDTNGLSTSNSAIGPVVLLGGAFYLITSGCTVFTLLVSRPARRLGNVSYGIYLLQGLVLAAVFRPAPLRDAAIAHPAYHWTLALLAAVLLVAVATAAHVGIERPGIALGRYVAAANAVDPSSMKAKDKTATVVVVLRILLFIRNPP